MKINKSTIFLLLILITLLLININENFQIKYDKFFMKNIDNIKGKNITRESNYNLNIEINDLCDYIDKEEDYALLLTLNLIKYDFNRIENCKYNKTLISTDGDELFDLSKLKKTNLNNILLNLPYVDPSSEKFYNLNWYVYRLLIRVNNAILNSENNIFTEYLLEPNNTKNYYEYFTKLITYIEEPFIQIDNQIYDDFIITDINIYNQSEINFKKLFIDINKTLKKELLVINLKNKKKYLAIFDTVKKKYYINLSKVIPIKFNQNNEFNYSPENIKFKINIDNSIKLNAIEVDIRNSNNNKINSENIFQITRNAFDVTEYDCPTINDFILNMRNSTDLQDREIDINNLNKTVTLNDKYKIYSDIHFPCNYRVIFLENASLAISKDVSLFVKNDLDIKGQVDKRIIIKELNENNKWGSIVVTNNTNSNRSNKVNISNLNISGGSEVTKYGTNFKGMLSIYGSEIKINSSSFFNNHGEDLVNLVGSDFIINDSVFNNAYSDAIDVDWSNGVIKNSQIKNTGINGDGIDTSYSKIDISNNYINGSKDKCISIGEDSDVNITNMIIEKCNVGIAGKDSSFLDIKNILILNSDTAISAYNKKNIFRGSLIKINNLISHNNSTKFEKDKKSIIEYSNIYNFSDNSQIVKKIINEIIDNNKYYFKIDML